MNKPHQPPRVPGATGPAARPATESEEGDQPTILISGQGAGLDKTASIPGKSYSVSPRKSGALALDDATGVTEEIHVEEVQDVVVLLDEIPQGHGAKPSASPPRSASPVAADGELNAVSDLPQLETLEDITSMIRDAEGGDLQAPATHAGEFDGPLPETSVTKSKGKGRVWMAAAAALVVVGGTAFFLLNGGGSQTGVVANAESVKAPGREGVATAENQNEKLKLACGEYQQWARESLRQGFTVR